MKKIVLSLLMAGFVMFCSIAQETESATKSDELVSKKGIPILPQSGDWALGLDATPFFQYVGNMLSSNNYFTPQFGFTAQTPGAIHVKYQYSKSTAYRAIVLIGATTETEKQGATNADEPDIKINYSALSVGLQLGIEKSKSIRGRIMGYYGAMAGIAKTPYNAGSYMGKLSYTDVNDSDNDYKQVGGNTMTISVTGFVGVEYFFAPKFSLGGEFGFTLNGSAQGKRVQKYEAAGIDDATLDWGSTEIGLNNVASGDLVLRIYL